MIINGRNVALGMGECSDEEFFKALGANEDCVCDVSGIGGVLFVKNEESGGVDLYIDCPASDCKIKIAATFIA